MSSKAQYSYVHLQVHRHIDTTNFQSLEGFIMNELTENNEIMNKWFQIRLKIFMFKTQNSPFLT